MPSARLSIPVLYVLCAPWDGLVLALALIVAPLLGLRLSARRGVVWAVLPERAPLSRIWRYSTTLGHLVLLQERAAGSDVEDHELVHVLQFEGAVASLWLAAAAGFTIQALFGAAFGAALVLLLGPWWSYFGASLSAWLRGGAPYLDNAFERHARAEVLWLAQASSENGVKSVSRSK